jgi:hypothetical protein
MNHLNLNRSRNLYPNRVMPRALGNAIGRDKIRTKPVHFSKTRCPSGRCRLRLLYLTFADLRGCGRRSISFSLGLRRRLERRGKAREECTNVQAARPSTRAAGESTLSGTAKFQTSARMRDRRVCLSHLYRTFTDGGCRLCLRGAQKHHTLTTIFKFSADPLNVPTPSPRTLNS